MSKINWDLERAKNYMQSKGFSLKHTLGSINYTCYVYERGEKRIEIWDDKSGELSVVNVMNRPIKLEDI